MEEGTAFSRRWAYSLYIKIIASLVLLSNGFSALEETTIDFNLTPLQLVCRVVAVKRLVVHNYRLLYILFLCPFHAPLHLKFRRHISLDPFICLSVHYSHGS